MKKYLPIVIILWFSVCAEARQQHGYWQYTGTIGKYAITLHLHQLGHSLTGYYYYQRGAQPIFFTGNDTALGGGRLLLLVYHQEPGYKQETFSLSRNTGQLLGSWQMGDSAALPVKASLAKDLFDFSLISVNGEVLLKANDTLSPRAVYENALVWPAAKTSAGAALRNHIRSRYQQASGSEDILSLLEKDKMAFLNEYRKMNESVADSEWAEYPFTYNSDITAHLLVMYQSPQWLTLAAWTYSYMGGAHGNYATHYTVYRSGTGTPLRAADVFLPSGKKRLSALLEKSFRSKFGVPTGEKLSDAGLFDDQILPNDNFYLTHAGIGFSYSPYEIGPYAMGQIELFIPFTSLKGILQPAFIKQAGIK